MSIAREPNGKISSRRICGIASIFLSYIYQFLFTFLEKPYSVYTPAIMTLTGLILLGFTTLDKVVSIVKGNSLPDINIEKQ